MSSRQSSPIRVAAVVLLAGLTLAACRSTPSTRRVALDIVETLDNISEEGRECMADKIEGYSDEELDAIANENADVDFSGKSVSQMKAAASEEWQQFVADLGECTGAAPSGESSEGTDGSTPSDDSNATDDSDAPDDRVGSDDSVASDDTMSTATTGG